MLPGKGDVMGPLEVMKGAGSFSPENFATCHTARITVAGAVSRRPCLSLLYA